MNQIAEAVVVQLIVGLVTFLIGSLSTWVIWINHSLRKAKRDINGAHKLIRDIILETTDTTHRLDCLERTIYYQGD